MIIQIEKLKLCTPNNFKLINFFLYILFFNIYVPNHLNDFLFTTDSLYEQGEYKKTFILLSDEYEKSSNDVRIAFRYARSIFMLANTEKNIQKQNELYYYGLAKAQEALLLDTNNAYSNFWYASYLGKIGQIEGFEKSILNSYKMKEYAIKAIKLDPDFSPSYHMMGRWHYELSSLNFFEKIFAETIYGELPNSSYDSAVSFFEKALEIEPKNIRYNFWLAKVLSATNNSENAISLHKRIVNLEPKDIEEAEIISKSKKIIRENER